MSEQPPLTDDIASVLRRYTEIQDLERSLKQEKTQLQERLAAHMQASACAVWTAELDGAPLTVRCTPRTTVEYDETRLREVLGERYTRILDLDHKKLKQHLPRVRAQLEPLLPLIGSPTPDRVRVAIEDGAVQAEEFAGAFRKQVKHSVAVMRARKEQPAADRPGPTSEEDADMGEVDF